MLEKLKKLNEFPIYSCDEKEFKKYGQVITGYDFEELKEYAEKHTPIPETGNIYVASDAEMEKLAVYEDVKNNIYGGMDTEFGYCNGNNSLLNGLEYHKGSEINVAITDLVLLLAHINDIENGKIDSSKVVGFYIPKGKVIEVYQTTMHFSPCKLADTGFKCIVILPRYTNTDIDLKNKKIIFEEDKYLFKRNKWLLVHNDKQDFISKGAYEGIIGKNLKVNY